MTGPNTLLGLAADQANISATGLQRMRTMAHKLRNGWIPDDESDLNDVLCMLPGFEDIAARLADEAAMRERMARDIIRELLALCGQADRYRGDADKVARARAFIAEEA